MMYQTGAQLLEYMKKNEMKKISEAVLAKEMLLTGKSEEEIRSRTADHYAVMKQSASRALTEKVETVGGMISGDSRKMEDYRKGAGALCGDTIARAMARALSCSEVNASMGKICAAPTAGACGILPAAVITVAEELNAPAEAVTDAMITAAGVGAIITDNATVSGAEGGCQAECGTAAAMAAAAVVQLRGGSADTALCAAGIALENILGLVCDPSAGIVEAPCAKRNASGTVNAILSADLALAGIRSDVPFDEVVDAMYHVGRALPTSLRETALGGIAAAPSAKAISRKIFGR